MNFIILYDVTVCKCSPLRMFFLYHNIIVFLRSSFSWSWINKNLENYDVWAKVFPRDYLFHFWQTIFIANIQRFSFCLLTFLVFFFFFPFLLFDLFGARPRRCFLRCPLLTVSSVFNTKRKQNNSNNLPDTGVCLPICNVCIFKNRDGFRNLGCGRKWTM